MPHAPGDWAVVIPVKALARAKTRLGREDLALPFLADAVAALHASPAVRWIVLATSDPDAIAWGTAHGCLVVPDAGCTGINDAAQRAIDYSWGLVDPGLGRGPSGVAVMVSDLPCLTPDSIAAALGLAAGVPVGFVADADGTGTTTWCTTARTSAGPAFGLHSCAAHRALGAVDLVSQADATTLARLVPARRDVDTADALLAATAIGVGAATLRALELSGT